MRKIVQHLIVLVLFMAAVVVLWLAAWRGILDYYAGARTHAPEDAPWVLSDSAQALVARAFDGPTSVTVTDYRVAGYSRGQLSGPDFDNRSRYRADEEARGAPLIWLDARLREHASGIRDESRADAEYISRVLRQIRAMPGGYTAHLLARDARYTDEGRRDDERTLRYVDNEYIAWLASRAPDRLVPVVSVHPYRTDAVAALERWANAGIRHVAWRPVAQNIDLTDPRLSDYYAILAAEDMTLQLPLGFREADNGARGWIDPRALRRALDLGVSVVVTLGGSYSGDGARLMPRLFELLREPAYRKLLTIDLAGVLSPGRVNTLLLPLLQHPQFYSRLRYASGYPETAIRGAIDLEALAARDVIPRQTLEPLSEIRTLNPLLFTFVVMRELRLPGTALHFPAQVFFQR